MHNCGRIVDNLAINDFFFFGKILKLQNKNNS